MTPEQKKELLELIDNYAEAQSEYDVYCYEPWRCQNVCLLENKINEFQKK